jgi:phosphoribosylamine--glycine ligase
MNVLVIGAGGREHALCWAIAQSPKLSELFCAPGNGGIAQVAECVSLDAANHEAVLAFCRDHDIGFVVIGPEAPLVDGLADTLERHHILAFGPSAEAAQLEGSKAFTKQVCEEHNIPTAAFGHFVDADSAKNYVRARGAPIVIKADGLAAGKGVTVATSLDEALAAIDACFDGAFGAAGAEVVVEEMLEGEEASFFALVDGNTAVALATAQDHKRVGEGDSGPNTGGMGAYSPAPVMSKALCQRTMDEIITPTVAALAARGTPFKGVLYAGLMVSDEGPKLIEYNVRFGDPECQVLMMRLKSDFLDALLATAEGTLAEQQITWHDDAALCVVMAAKGYPGDYEKGSAITNLEAAGSDNDVEIFHAGTALRDGETIAAGGRVLTVTVRAATVSAAQAKAYEAVAQVDWPQGFCRRDIGWRAIERERAT